MGIMEKQMETTLMGCKGFRFRVSRKERSSGRLGHLGITRDYEKGPSRTIVGAMLRHSHVQLLHSLGCC